LIVEIAMVRSFVRIYGPPVLEAIDALESIAVELSKTTGIKFSHTCIPYPERLQSNKTDWETFLKKMQDIYVDCYEPLKLISDSAYMLGEYDFFFEWDEKPSLEEIRGLIGRIDEALKGMGCMYTTTTK
jgi:hypothetical protein